MCWPTFRALALRQSKEFSISTSTLRWYILHFTAMPIQTKTSFHGDWFQTSFNILDSTLFYTAENTAVIFNLLINSSLSLNPKDVGANMVWTPLMLWYLQLIHNLKNKTKDIIYCMLLSKISRIHWAVIVSLWCIFVLSRRWKYNVNAQIVFVGIHVVVVVDNIFGQYPKIYFMYKQYFLLVWSTCESVFM